MYDKFVKKSEQNKFKYQTDMFNVNVYDKNLYNNPMSQLNNKHQNNNPYRSSNRKRYIENLPDDSLINFD